MAEIPTYRPPEATQPQEISHEDKIVAFYSGDDIYQAVMNAFASQDGEAAFDTSTGNFFLDWWEKTFGIPNAEALARHAAAGAAAVREEGRQDLLRWGINPEWTPEKGRVWAEEKRQTAIDTLIIKGVDPTWILPQRESVDNV